MATKTGASSGPRHHEADRLYDLLGQQSCRKSSTLSSSPRPIQVTARVHRGCSIIY